MPFKNESLVSEDGEELEVVPLAHLVIIGVMSGCNLDRTGAELPLDKSIRYDR